MDHSLLQVLILSCSGAFDIVILLYHLMHDKGFTNVRRVTAIAHAGSSIQHTAGAQQIRNTRFNVGSSDQTTDGPSVDSGRAFLFIAPEMRCLDVIRVIVPPRPSHTFGIPMIWHDV